MKPGSSKDKIIRDRIDNILVKKGLAKSRDRAKALILAGVVMVNETKVDKAGTRIDENSSIRLLKNDHEYVSRGALKILGAMDHFNIDVRNKIVMDAGASTGGFTEVMLKRGASKVFAVDVGYGILDWKLKSDPRVISLERTNARDVGADKIKEPIDFISMDLSFISLKKVIPNLVQFLKGSGALLALIKPQFEVGKKEVERGGLVKDISKHKRVISEIEKLCESNSLHVVGTVESKVKGLKGNQEYFIYCIKT